MLSSQILRVISSACKYVVLSYFVRSEVNTMKRRDSKDRVTSKPPGINNTENNCYANSILQCLLNNSTFFDLSQEVVQAHSSSSCTRCQSSGMIILCRLGFI